MALSVELANIMLVLLKGTQRNWLVEILIEGDFAANLCGRQINPCIVHVGAYFTLEITINVFLNGNLLCVAQVAVGLIFLKQVIGIVAESVISQPGLGNIVDFLQLLYVLAAGLVQFLDDGSGFRVSLTHGTGDGFQLGGADGELQLLGRLVDALRKDIVVQLDFGANGVHQSFCSIHQFAAGFPLLRADEFGQFLVCQFDVDIIQILLDGRHIAVQS